MNNSVRQLNAFVDYNGLLRCGGRITNANLPYDIKFPYVIPKNKLLYAISSYTSTCGGVTQWCQRDIKFY